MLGVDECAFPDLAPMSGYNYGCRCPRCMVHRKRYDGRRDGQRTRPYIGPCRCPNPQHERIGIFNAVQCAACGLPIR